MNTLYRLLLVLIVCCTVAGMTSCEKENLDTEEAPFAPYVLSLGVNSHGTTTYYVVTASDLMSGNINAVGKGLEQNGYRDYEQANQTIFSIGGLGVTSATGIVRNTDGFLTEQGDFVFNNSLNAFTQMDHENMLGLELPANKESGSKMTFYTVDIDNVSITSQTTHTPVYPMDELEWPSITGMCYSEGNVYVTYFPMNPSNFETLYTDTTYVAVYSYPEMNFKTLMKDTRTGPAGSWNAFNGIFKVESGDMYVMSNSAIANGFSQGTKNAGFLRIPKGETRFDDYHFDFEATSGGLKPAHIKYIGDGLVFAEVSTVKLQTVTDRWQDKNLKCCIIDLNNKTISDIKEIPVHNGNGGRRFSVLSDGGYVYYPVTTSEGTYIYRVDPRNATAERGAKVSTSFVGGFFRLN